MIKNRFYCGALLGFWMVVMPVQAEDLKAYYEQQKLEIAKTFVAPEAGTEITLVLLDGKEKSGVIRHLSDTGVQILSDNALATFRKHELDEATCAQLFAEEYAHAEAIKRTRAHKRGASARAKTNTHSASLSVISKNKRTSFNETENEEVEEGAWNIETKKRNEVKTLSISVANRTSHPDTYTLKWYFYEQEVGKDNITIQSRGSEEISLNGQQAVKRKIVSKEYVAKTVTRNWLACCGKSSSSQKKSGKQERGYLVVLKCGDKVLARKASSKLYLDPDWVKLCQ